MADLFENPAGLDGFEFVEFLGHLIQKFFDILFEKLMSNLCGF